MNRIRFGKTKVLIQTLLTLSRSYSQTILHTFLHIKQYWHFQRVPSKLNYSKNFFHITKYWHFLRITTKQSQIIQSSYQTVFILSELLPSNSKHFFESFNGHLNRQKFLIQKIPQIKWEKLAYTHETDNFPINYSWVTWFFIDGFMEENDLLPPPRFSQNGN